MLQGAVHCLRCRIAGLIYVSSNSSAITVYTTDGTYAKTIGTFRPGITTNVDGEYNNPYMLVVDAGGTVYVVDTTCRVQVLQPDGTKKFTYFPNPCSLAVPMRVAVDGLGRIFLSMSDNQNTVWLHDRAASVKRPISTTATPGAIAVDNTGSKLFVLEAGTSTNPYGAMCCYNTSNGQQLWQVNFTSNQPSVLAVDSSNTKLYTARNDNVTVYAAADGSLMFSWQVDVSELSLYSGGVKPQISGASVGDAGLLYMTDVNGRIIISTVGGTTLRSFSITGNTTGIAMTPFSELPGTLLVYVPHHWFLSLRWPLQ